MVSLPRSGSLCHLRWQVPTGHTLPFGAGGGRRKVALLTQGCRIHRACQRGRPPAGSGQPVPRSRGIPSPNRRFGEGTRDSDLTSEGFGSRSLNRRGGRWPRPPLVSLPASRSLWPLRAQVPTGHTLPFGAPKPYAAAFFVSVASVRRTQETRLFPKPWVFQRSEFAPLGANIS